MEEEITIDHFSSKGRGIGLLDRPVPSKVEVVSALPGDRVRVELGTKRKGVYKSFFRELLHPSPLRVEARCQHASTCGGCAWQQLGYPAQLREKEKIIAKAFARFPEVKIEPIIPCASPWEYRNKMEFSFSQNKAGERFLGLILAGSRGRVFNVMECSLVSPWFAETLQAVREWWTASKLQAYRMPTDEGALRTLILREGKRTGDRMVMLTVSGNPRFALTKEEIQSFKNLFQGSVSLFLRIQQQIKGVPTQFYEVHLSGPDHIKEELEIEGKKLLFKISPSSFFQPNTAQAEILYANALSLLDLPPDAHVMDLYCGTATIGIALAQKAAKVTGIELNPYSIFDGEMNREMNGVSNLTLIRGDVGAKLKELQAQPEYIPPYAAVVDPPRTGLDPLALENLLSLSPKKILYISCNPQTQADNLLFLTQAGYQISHLQPVDQFPHTVHIENIALLTQR